MSVADPTVATADVRTPRMADVRFLRSELRLLFGRRRNLVALAVLAAVPVVVAVAVDLAAPSDGGGPPFITAITSNGLFVALTALSVELPLFLPLAVAAVAGDAIAGEANLGTLRYLLTVPVSRARTLFVKYLGVVAFGLVATLLVATVGVLVGLAFFGGGPVLLLSGVEVSFAEGLWRLLLVCGYITCCLAAFGAVGLFLSTLTEQPIGATIALAVLAMTSQILDSISQLSVIHEYLPTHWWFGFSDLLRDPIATESAGPGLLSAGAYTAIFLTAAWARFTSRDISS